MKKLITPAISVIGIILPVLAILFGINSDLHKYFFQSGNKVIFYFNNTSFEILLALIGFGLLLWSVIRIKNFQITKWILFTLSGVFLIGTTFFAIEEHISDVFELLLFIIPGILFAGTMVLSLLIKRKLWTKILLIIGTSFIIVLLLVAQFFNQNSNGYSKGWEHTAALLKDTEQPDRKVYLQNKEDIERYIITRRVFPGIFNYRIIDPISIPDKSWEVLNDELLGEIKLTIKVNSREEFMKAIASEKYGTYIINGKINLLGDWLIQNQDNIILSGSNNEGISEAFISSSTIPIKNCNNLTLKGLNLAGGLEFQNCTNITIENCNFIESETNSVYFYEDCDEITVRNNSFKNYSKYAINAPYVNLNLSSNQFDNSSGIEDKNFRINIRGFFNNLGWDSFYKPLLCQTYDFNLEDQIEYFDDCNLGTYIGSIVTDNWGYWLNDVFSDISSLNFSMYDMKVDYLRMLSGGIDPTLREPYGKKYSTEYELPIFSYYNPKFIEYWMERMIPSPDEYFGYQTFQVLYNNSFRYHVQVLIESYLVFNSNYEAETEVDWYIKEAKRDSWEFPETLNSRYNFEPKSNEFAQIYSLEYINSNSLLKESTGSVVGFWIRREIDGTAKFLFESLLSIVKDYDQAYYSWITQEYDI